MITLTLIIIGLIIHILLLPVRLIVGFLAFIFVLPVAIVVFVVLYLTGMLEIETYLALPLLVLAL